MKLKERPEDFVVEEKGTWATGTGQYALFTLTKRDIGTLEAVKLLADAWHIPAKDIGYAGLKDKRAVTTQTCSAKVPRLTVERTNIRGIEAKFLGNSERPVSLGSHTLNHFVITVRDIDSLPEKKTRFLNLFGEQRFGSKNAEIGKTIVLGDYKKTLALLREMNLPETQEIEQHIANEPTDVLGAIKRLPLRLLRLFVHAYQSKLWNGMASFDAPEQLPIIGFGSDTSDPFVRKQLAKEGLTPRSFVLKSFPQLSEEGTVRNTFVDVNDLSIGKLEKDEISGRKKVTVRFTLPPGSYATEIIRQLFTEP